MNIVDTKFVLCHYLNKDERLQNVIEFDEHFHGQKFYQEKQVAHQEANQIHFKQLIKQNINFPVKN